MVRRGDNKGLTTIASSLIIIGLVVAIGIIFIVIYNVVSSEIEYSTESNISLQIEKSSVVIDENTDKVSLNVLREEGDSELEKIKFVLFDGENIEEIEKNANDLREGSSKEFSFTPKLVTNIKTISIVPIIKIDGKRKYLAVANSISVTRQDGGETTIKESETTCGNAVLETGEECDDGNLISGDGCSVGCKNETSTTTDSTGSSNCGNSVVDSDEECDKGSSNGVQCSAAYGKTCTYCSSSCQNVIFSGGSCGDGTCQSSSENSETCLGDCPLCEEGDTQPCSIVGAFGTQTCGSDNNWGTCVYNLYTLTLSKTGTGIDCGSTCAYNFSSGASVTLTATSGTGYYLSGWSGACSGATCVVSMNSAKSVSVTFVAYTYSWYAGSWSVCNPCGASGTQTREVYCKRNDGTQVEDSYCSGVKLATSQSCTRQCVCGTMDAGYYFGGSNLVNWGSTTMQQCLDNCNSYSSSAKKSCWWYGDGGCVLGSDYRFPWNSGSSYQGYASNCV